MDAMEDMDLLSGSNTHLSKLSSECNMGTNKGIFPGLKYRHLGKSGFKVSNLILGKLLNFTLIKNRRSQEKTAQHSGFINCYCKLEFFKCNIRGKELNIFHRVFEYCKVASVGFHLKCYRYSILIFFAI